MRNNSIYRISFYPPYLQVFGEKYYRKESFVYVINTGLLTDISTNLSFSDIKSKLIQIYNAA